MELCDAAKCVDARSPQWLKDRLSKRVDAMYAAAAEARRMDPQVDNRRTIASMRMKL